MANQQQPLLRKEAGSSRCHCSLSREVADSNSILPSSLSYSTAISSPSLSSSARTNRSSSPAAAESRQQPLPKKAKQQLSLLSLATVTYNNFIFIFVSALSIHSCSNTPTTSHSLTPSFSPTHG